jgi:hypothetical protein
LIDGQRPSKPLFDDGAEQGLARRTLERARAKLTCERIPPAKLRERIGDEAYEELPEE